MKHCKLFIDAERTPLHYENQNWVMNTKIQTVAPEQISEDDEEMTKKQSRLLIDIQSSFGSDRKSQLNVRIQGTYYSPLVTFHCIY